MIPAANKLLTDEIEFQEQPSKTYRINYINNTINGMVDGLSAMEQVVYKILNTERYQHLIYSWDYGIELSDLLGEPISYVCPELERVITESLMQDERILSVDDFNFNTGQKGVVKATFFVHTIYGDVAGVKELNI